MDLFFLLATPFCWGEYRIVNGTNSILLIIILRLFGGKFSSSIKSHDFYAKATFIFNKSFKLLESSKNFLFLFEKIESSLSTKIINGKNKVIVLTEEFGLIDP